MSAPISTTQGRRRFRLAVFIILTLTAATVSGWWYWEYARWQESTDNAYFKGNLVSIAAKVPGQVVRLLHDEGDLVAAGERLVELAPGDAERTLAEARHMLGFAVRTVLVRRAEVATAEAELELRRTTHRLAEQEYRRRQVLRESRTVSEEEVDAARTRAEETRAELTIAERELATALLEAGSGPLERHPMVQVAAARLREAVRNLNKTRIISPVSGRIARRYAQIGQVMDAGTPMFSVVEADNFWIEANFKENQLRNLRPGQPVTATTDLYGDTLTLEGTITSIGAGTGAEFSVLPPQNATGNWIKIVQRVSVRIDFTGPAVENHPLPLGASLTLVVDTHDRGGSSTTNDLPLGRVSPGAVFEDLNDTADALIEEVIRQYSATTLSDHHTQ